MRLVTRWLTAATTLLVFAVPASAQSHPDLTGTWILDPTKTSVDGQIPAPAAATYTVAMHGDTMTVDQQSTTEMGAMSTKKVWAADGKAWANVMSYAGNDLQLSSVLTWKGTVLNVQTTTEVQGTAVQQAETWTPSSDGKQLTIVITTNVDGAYFAAMTLVFNKK